MENKDLPEKSTFMNRRARVGSDGKGDRAKPNRPSRQGRRVKEAAAQTSDNGGQEKSETSSAQGIPSKTNNGNKRQNRNRRINGTANGNNNNATKDQQVVNDGGSRGQEQNQANNNKSSSSKEPYPPYWTLEECLEAYTFTANVLDDRKNAVKTKSTSTPIMDAASQRLVIRGTLRVLPFSPKTASTTSSFVTCDRGLCVHDVCIPTEFDRNRAMDGDIVYVELLVNDEESSKEAESDGEDQVDVLKNAFQRSVLREELNDEAGDIICHHADNVAEDQTWQDDQIQADLWNPIPIARKMTKRRSANTTDAVGNVTEKRNQEQRKGRVIHILPPKAVFSEVHPHETRQVQTRRLVGTLKVLNRDGNTILLCPNNRSLPQFRCPTKSTRELIERFQKESKEEDKCLEELYFQAEYEYHSWKPTHKWPPCTRVKLLGSTCVLEDEIQALLVEYDVDHGDFVSSVLRNVDDAVKIGVYQELDANGKVKGLGWKPTPSMYKGRRDYRSERIFTIDPTTAKDLDDALHIRDLGDGCVEIGVHIADVSHFVRPGTPVDLEARRRSTTVYLVDRTVPMLPRPLCEIACSLNENVERLAFSCVWRMNMNGTLRTNKKGKEDVWYGRTIIISCARLDYSTAQNIIEKKVAIGESSTEMDEGLWPSARRPTGGHTIDQVAADVRLMHKVAMARRRLRFENGALGLHGIKLTFQLDSDGQTPLLTAPYPIRDSNRLVEEYMLLANYLVAQRLITHAGGRALLRCHKEPLDEGLENLAAVAKAATGFDIDISSSQSLHSSLVRLERECNDPLVLKCITQLMMTPMVPADYFAAGMADPEEWKHFALNIPYYTHFTSPIRRYPDVLVHRLLQATIDGPLAVNEFVLDERTIDSICGHCNEKRMASKKAQERCDRVFLSLFVKSHPIASQLGVVLSVGRTSFTVFVPSLGVNALLYLDEHKESLSFASEESRDGSRRILLQQKPDAKGMKWTTLEINIFTKLRVTIICKDKPPVDVKLRLEGPWTDGR